MKLFRSFNTTASVLAVLFILLCTYGVATDCPDTAGYVYCSKSERWDILH